ncbi:MAG: zinc-dependent alcohol dehydrogenase family protein [Microbacteriaceae bacterium]
MSLSRSDSRFDLMRAAQLKSLRELVIETRPTPIAGPGQLLIRVEAAGLCGTDRHIFTGESPATLPLIPGHEICGIIQERGADATRLAVGTRVTIDPNIACRTCAACRRGDPHLCENLEAIGVTRDGGFAEYVTVPQAQAYLLPSDLPASFGVFCEPLACCLHGLDVARIRPGDSVAIFGGGVIGLLMVQLARLAGATTVVLSTRQAARRTLAASLGATHTIDPAAHDPVHAIAGAGGIALGGVDVVLECAGTADTFSQSIATARRGGSVILFGVVPKGQHVSVEPHELLFRELRLEGAYVNPFTHGRAAELVASGSIALAPLITQTVPLDELPRILGSAPGNGEVKTLVVPEP